MKYLLVLSLFSFFCLKNEEVSKQIVNDNFSFEFVSDFPFKIDGGSFYTFDTTSLSKEKFIFVISKTGAAFMQKSGQFIMFHRAKRVSNKDSYSDVYDGEKNYQIALDVKKIRSISIGKSEYAGKLILKLGKENRTILIHGLVDDAIR